MNQFARLYYSWINMNKLCWLLGHNWHIKSYHFLYVCSRCGIDENMLDAYDYSTPAISERLGRLVNGITTKLNRWRWIIKTTLEPEKCDICGEIRFVAGQEVGNHDDCLIPF